MRTFEFESVEQAYPQIIKTILEEGKEVSPRGQLTREITPACITILNPRKRVLPSQTRKLNFGFTVAELIWILQGSDDVKFISHYNSNWSNFSDDGETLNGAYGKRIFAWDSGTRFEKQTIKGADGEESEETLVPKRYIINQFQKAFEQLKLDSNTRQATIVFFDPLRDYNDTKDKPCTNLIRFMIRDGKLNMTTFMRSNDIWLGFPYDVYNFTMLQELMAGLLDVEVGVYNHIVDSLHMYEQHFEKGMAVINEKTNLLYSDKLVDARISVSNVNLTLHKVYDIERLTREEFEIDINKITNILDSIENEYWKSIAALLALYNFRKYFRSQSELDILKKYITNEFAGLIIDWNAKK